MFEYCWLFNLLFPRYKETFPLRPNINLQQLDRLYLYKHDWDIVIFLCIWSLQNLETLREYSYFYGNIFICLISIKNMSSLYQETIVNTGCITKIWLECHIWERDVQTQIWSESFKEPRLTTQPIKTLRKTGLVPCLQES